MWDSVRSAPISKADVWLRFSVRGAEVGEKLREFRCDRGLPPAALFHPVIVLPRPLRILDRLHDRERRRYRWGRHSLDGLGRGCRGHVLKVHSATTVGSWKTASASRAAFFATLSASIRPRRWARGKQGDSPDVLECCQSFNSATTVGSWKTSSCAAQPDPAIMLQFGHDGGLVENQHRIDDQGHRESASSRPRRWARGKREAGHQPVLCADGFNSATTVGSWKTCAPTPTPTPTPRFNSATTVGSWKTSNSAPITARDSPLQFGHDGGLVENISPYPPTSIAFIGASIRPRRWARGKPPALLWRPCRIRCFNSATTVGSWKTSLRRILTSAGAVLQFGHDGGLVENEYRSENRRQNHLRLQFGHDGGLVENWRVRLGGVRVVGASIRPRRWARGKLLVRSSL